MTRIKICGITNDEDARVAVEYGADALGIIAVPESPRYVSSEEEFCIREVVKPFVTVVIVARCVDDAEDYAPDAIQFYEGRAYRVPDCIRAFRIKDAHSLAEIAGYAEPVTALLLDTYHDGALGGVGKTFDWSLAVEAKRIAGDIPIILAGGLTPENVGEAIAAVRPYAVDVSSGVEAKPGRKDHSRVKAFIRAVREADRRLEDP